ncbi:MAG: hypothetical protein JEZ04_16075 [Spirochaetales bacterium]|nr:hypothetical protein [Spirochaetales bacterium]
MIFSHTFTAAEGGLRLLETITVSNTGSLSISPLSLDFGFRKMLLTQKGGWQEDLDRWILEALPTRRYCSQKVDRRREHYTASDLLYAPFDDEEENLKPGFAAEGWIWGSEEGRILKNKYNPSEIEFSRFRRIPILLPGRGMGNTALLFGGAAQYRGDPERSFDELWGCELMWNPLQDLLSGKALSLYEYNLSCPIPLYLHINSGCDNSTMLQFWWYASTVRHLGIGGIADENTLEFSNLHSDLKLYKTLRKFLVYGIFYGIEPLVHLHTSKEVRGTYRRWWRGE